MTDELKPCPECEGDGVINVKRGEGSDSVEERPCPKCDPKDPRNNHGAALLMIAELNREVADLRSRRPAPAVTDETRDRIDTLLSKMEGFVEAYPLDIFPKPTKEQTEWLHKERPGLCDRISASMGRHVAGMIAADLKALHAALETPDATG